MNNRKEVKQVLNCLFPGYLVILALAPTLFGFVVDSALANSRYLVINLVWMLVFTVFCIWFRSRIVYRLVVFFFFITGFVELCHWLLLKGPLTLTSLIVFANSNYNEALGFLSLKTGFGLLGLIPYILCFLLAWRKYPQPPNFAARHYLTWLTTAAIAIFICENAVNQRLIRRGVPLFVKTSYDMVKRMEQYNRIFQHGKPRKVKAHLTSKESVNRLFVLIIGESLSKRHMALYGYKRNTNPLLKERSDILVFSNVISGYSNTIDAVMSIMSQSNLENDLSPENSVDLIDVFHSAGYKTYWLSNQSPFGIWENVITSMARKADKVNFVNISSSSSMESTVVESYDERLFQPFRQALNEKVPLKFIVLHLMGSHSAYAKRYPSTFNRFEYNDLKSTTIAEYDNTVLYNDYVINRIINMTASAKNTATSLLYLSDHGENVYDTLNKVGHDFAGSLPLVNVEIPFILWTSPFYDELFSPKLRVVFKNRDVSFISDDLFHLAIDLNSIESPFLEQKRSIASPSFDTLRYFKVREQLFGSR